MSNMSKLRLSLIVLAVSPLLSACATLFEQDEADVLLRPGVPDHHVLRVRPPPPLGRSHASSRNRAWPSACSPVSRSAVPSELSSRSGSR